MRIAKITALSLLMLLSASWIHKNDSFEQSMKYSARVKEVYERKEELFNMRCRTMEIPEETFGNIFIRVFKMEKIMELWVEKADGSYVKFKEFDIYAMSGRIGPKERQGDHQVPEGFYYVVDYNPESRYYLSLGINYPNEADNHLYPALDKGDEIYIHGNKVSAGCMAMSNYYIEDIFMAAVKAHSHGQHRVPVQIYPFKPSSENMIYYKQFGYLKQYHKFWDNIAEGYKFFAKTNRLPDISVGSDGYYVFQDPHTAQVAR